MLRGKGLQISDYPSEAVSAPGFYYNKAAARIEHWSLPTGWNLAMVDHAMNSKGIVNDGFISILHEEDVDTLGEKLKVWFSYIARMEAP